MRVPFAFRSARASSIRVRSALPWCVTAGMCCCAATSLADAVRGVQIPDLFRRHQAKPMTVISRKPGDMGEFVHAILVAGQSQRAGRKARLLRQDIPVQANRIRPQFLDRRMMGEMRTQSGDMPGGSMGQIVFLDKDNVFPS